MKKKLSVIWNILQVIIIIFVILVTVFVLCKNKYGYTEIANHNFSYVSKKDTNYLNNTSKGDLLVIKKDSNPKEGDNIFYYDIDKNKYVIRQDKVVKKENSSYYISNSVELDKSKIIGKDYKTISKLGGLLSILETKKGFILFIIFPLVVIFIYQVYKFISTIKEEKNKIEETIKEESPEETKKEPAKEEKKSEESEESSKKEESKSEEKDDSKEIKEENSSKESEEKEDIEVL